MSRVELRRCSRCDYRLDPLTEPYTYDGLGWVCVRCVTDDEIEAMR